MKNINPPWNSRLFSSSFIGSDIWIRRKEWMSKLHWFRSCSIFFLKTSITFLVNHSTQRETALNIYHAPLKRVLKLICKYWWYSVYISKEIKGNFYCSYYIFTCLCCTAVICTQEEEIKPPGLCRLLNLLIHAKHVPFFLDVLKKCTLVLDQIF